jgi:hypothetical protein
MSAFSYALGALVLIFVLLRQVRVVPVPRTFAPRLPVFLGVLGLLTLGSYSGDHHASSGAWVWVLATLVVGAPVLGALRGLAMRVWATQGWVFRQATGVTMALWLVSLLLHVVVDTAGHGDGVSGLDGSSFLLYLGITLWAQYALVHHRARPLFAQLGPAAARPFGFTTTGGPGVFFTTFRTGAPGPRAGAPDPGRPSDIIDAEVVEDDDDPGPPQVGRPD